MKSRKHLKPSFQASVDAARAAPAAAKQPAILIAALQARDTAKMPQIVLVGRGAVDSGLYRDLGAVTEAVMPFLTAADGRARPKKAHVLKVLNGGFPCNDRIVGDVIAVLKKLHGQQPSGM